MSKETVLINPNDIPNTEQFLGKRLCHIRHAKVGEGYGFAFCLGDSAESMSGPLILCVDSKMYPSGQWSDEDRVIYQCGKQSPTA